jgi:hypothetical protein
MGIHFTNHAPQLGMLVVVAFIVNANQDVFDGLRHDPRLPFTRPRVPMEQIGISEYGRVWAKYGQEWLAIAGRPLARFFVAASYPGRALS